MKNLVFTVTNDLTYDQRMIRICNSLARSGFSVLLVGREQSGSKPLIKHSFKQKRLRCLFHRGKLFYFEYNLRLFFWLLFQKVDCICAIDLDTILPCFLVSRLRGVVRVYDAHELFCEMKEIVQRPRIYKAWKMVERHIVPQFRNGYTVNQPIADAFRTMYGVEYAVIRNVAVLDDQPIPVKHEKYILYQGAVNEGRSFETLIPAMMQVDARLIICGDGNFMSSARQLVKDHGLENKIIFKGKVEPSALKNYTINAWVGITLFENNGLNNYYSLANRFFDYMHAGIPQVCVDYPLYSSLNNIEPFAVLLKDLQPGTIAAAINRLLHDHDLYHTLQTNALSVRRRINWQEEEKKLVAYYRNLNWKIG
jgi:glycosyltransferase involved in cell wall biosynthesis